MEAFQSEEASDSEVSSNMLVRTLRPAEPAEPIRPTGLQTASQCRQRLSTMIHHNICAEFNLSPSSEKQTNKLSL